MSKNDNVMQKLVSAFIVWSMIAVGIVGLFTVQVGGADLQNPVPNFVPSDIDGEEIEMRDWGVYDADYSITIQNGGTLRIINSTLNFPQDVGSDYSIDVITGGSLILENSTITTAASPQAMWDPLFEIELDTSTLKMTDHSVLAFPGWLNVTNTLTYINDSWITSVYPEKPTLPYVDYEEDFPSFTDAVSEEWWASTTWGMEDFKDDCPKMIFTDCDEVTIADSRIDNLYEDMEEIMKHTNPDKRTLLFSATMPGRIKALAEKYMDGYELIKVKKERLTTHLTEQIYFEVKASDKFEALCRIIDIENDFYGLIFCRTKSDVDNVASHLSERGYDAEAIHGDLSQAQREKTLDKFKQQKANILVATDVAARGLDVNNLTHVINYALPQDPESYVHRIGRTGRAGNEGTAITFITPSEYKRLMFIQRVAKTDIKKSKIPKIGDIITAKKKKIYEDLNAVLAGKIDNRYYNWAKHLLENNNPAEILAAVLNYCFEDELNPDAYGEIQEFGSGKGKQIVMEGKTRLFVALGKKDKFNPKKLVELIMSKVSIKSHQIREIQVMDRFSFMTVPFGKAEKIIANFRENGKKPLITHAKKSGR